MGMGPFYSAEKVLFWFCRGYMRLAEAICTSSAEAICILQRLYTKIAEAICSFCENIDQLSPAEAGAGTELGNKKSTFFDQRW